MNQPRKSLADVLHGGDRNSLARAFAEADVAGELAALPRGEYRCRVTNGELVTSKGGTPGYRITFTIDTGEHKGRRVWHTGWLTPAAMPMTKRDVGRLGIASLEQMELPIPPGIVTDVKVVARVDDDGTERNYVTGFTVVDVIADPTADTDFPSTAPSTEVSR
jgi:hypothetical protein